MGGEDKHKWIIKTLKDLGVNKYDVDKAYNTGALTFAFAASSIIEKTLGLNFGGVDVNETLVDTYIARKVIEINTPPQKNSGPATYQGAFGNNKVGYLDKFMFVGIKQDAWEASYRNGIHR